MIGGSDGKSALVVVRWQLLVRTLTYRVGHINHSVPERLCGPLRNHELRRTLTRSVVCGSYQPGDQRERQHDNMADTGNNSKAAPPMFSGKRDEYINWRRQFAAHMRDEKSINNNQQACR